MWLYLSSTDCLAVVQAGRIDGAREIRIFRSLVAPLASPAIVTVFLLIIVSIWNNYLLPYLVLSNPRLQPGHCRPGAMGGIWRSERGEQPPAPVHTYRHRGDRVHPAGVGLVLGAPALLAGRAQPGQHGGVAVRRPAIGAPADRPALRR